jgi:hypothetical protein
VHVACAGGDGSPRTELLGRRPIRVVFHAPEHSFAAPDFCGVEGSGLGIADDGPNISVCHDSRRACEVGQPSMGNAVHGLGIPASSSVRLVERVAAESLQLD